MERQIFDERPLGEFSDDHADIEWVATEETEQLRPESRQGLGKIAIDRLLAEADRLTTQNDKDWLKVTDVAIETGMPVKWVMKTSEYLGIRPTKRHFNQFLIDHYPPETIAQLKQEVVWQRKCAKAHLTPMQKALAEQAYGQVSVGTINTIRAKADRCELAIETEEQQWQENYAKAPSEVTIYTISKLVGRSSTWVQQTINELGANPLKTTLYRTNIEQRLYSKTLLAEIRQNSVMYNTPYDHFTLDQLKVIANQNGRWIENILAKNNIPPHPSDTRQQRSTIPRSYPPQALEIIIEAINSRPPYGGDWLTTSYMQHMLGKSNRWVAQRLVAYQDMSMDRQDDHGVARTHYPKEVLENLRKMAEDDTVYDQKGEFYTAHEMSGILGRNYAWVERKLKEIDAQGELRFNQNSWLLQCYPPSVLQELRALSDAQEAQKNDELFTLTDIATQVGRHWSWVKKILEEANVPSDILIDSTGRQRLHYPKEALDIVSRKIDEIADLQKGDYLSLVELSSAVSKYYENTKKILRDLNIKPVDRYGKDGVLHKYYPPETVGLIQQYISNKSDSRVD